MHALIRSAFVATAAVFLIPQAVSAQPAKVPSALIGTWKLDAAASHFTSPRVIKSETRTYAQEGGKVVMHSVSTDTKGKDLKVSFSAAYDGKFYPMTGNPVGDSIALKLSDPRTVEATVKKGQAVTAQSKTVISADGKRMVQTRNTKVGAGQAVDKLTFVKQD